MALTTETYTDDDRKWGQDSQQYEGFVSKNVSGISLATDLGSKSSSISATFEKKGKDEDGMIKDIRGLLENAGFSDIEFKTYNGGTFSVVVPEKEGLGMLKFASALAMDIEVGRDTVFGVLDKRDAQQLIEMELKRGNLTMQQAGLAAVAVMTMPDAAQRYGAGVEPPSYKDVDLKNFPFGPIEAMKEDGFPSKFAFEKLTQIEVRDGMATQVAETLKKSGIDARRSDDGKFVTAQGGVDDVAVSLGKAGMLPAPLVQEIAAAKPAAPVAKAPTVAAIKPQAPAAMKM